MSRRPKALAGNFPVGAGCFLSQGEPQPSQSACWTPTAGPQKYAVVVRARAAYSHSDSLSSRYGRPVSLASHVTYCCASCQSTLITGRSPRPQGAAGLLVQPPSLTQVSHWSKVMSFSATAKFLANVTSRCGPSSSQRPISSFGDPIVK